MSLTLWAPDADSFESFNDSADCLECHGYEPPYNCASASCHTIFSGGPGSEGHVAHLNIGLPQFCNACHAVVGDDPLTSTCTSCHLKKGLIKHHNYAAESTTLSYRDTGICWMCHDESTPAPEDTIPPGYVGICIPLDPCDGSEELFSNGSFTTSLDNDGDLLIDSADPDCFSCSPTARSLAVPHDYVTLQEAFDFAFDNDTIMSNKQTFIEDLFLNQDKAVYLEVGYNCSLTTITGKTTVEGKITMGSGTLIIRRGTLVVRTLIEDCTDGVDNDGDGLIDCNAPGCDSDIACLGPQTEVCTDCVDNDGNGFIDCDDASCSDDPDCSITFGICTACHGDPPVDESSLVSLGPGTGSVTAGAHARHVITDMYGCDNCHSGSVGGGPTHMNSYRITIGFSLFGGSYLGGTYDGQTTAIYDSSEVNTSVSNSGSMTCGTIYCHSNVQSVNGTAGPDAYASPMWDALSVACDSCHGQDPQETDGQPDSGSHNKHAGSQAGELNYDCSACHENGGAGTANHADEIINVDINNIYDDGGTAAYSQGDHLHGSNGYSTCSNVGCHIGTVTPVWGGSLPTEEKCIICHGDPPVTVDTGSPDGLVGAPGTTGATTPGVHELHATAQEWTVNRTYIRYIFFFPYYEIVNEPTLKKGYNFPCETCHEGGMSLLDPIFDTAIQVGGSVITYGGNRTLNPPYTIAGTRYSFKGASPADQNDSNRPVVTGNVILSGADMKCSTYCHSDGYAIYNGLVDTSVKSPAWGAVDSATSSLPCDTCHGYPPENGNSQYSSHIDHVSDWRYTCDKCHYETTEDGVTITNPAKHGDGNVDVAPHPGRSEFRYTFSPGGGGSCFYQEGGTQWPYVGCHLIDNPDSGLYGIHGPQTWKRTD